MKKKKHVYKQDKDPTLDGLTLLFCFCTEVLTLLSNPFFVTDVLPNSFASSVISFSFHLLYSFKIAEPLEAPSTAFLADSSIYKNHHAFVIESSKEHLILEIVVRWILVPLYIYTKGRGKCSLKAKRKHHML